MRIIKILKETQIWLTILQGDCKNEVSKNGSVQTYIALKNNSHYYDSFGVESAGFNLYNVALTRKYI